MPPRHSATPAPAATGNGRRNADRQGGAIEQTISQTDDRRQPAELPQISAARERDAAARARLRAGRPDPAEAARLGLPGRSGR